MENKNNILEEIGNKNPFSVPENYFEDFARNIQDKVKQEQAVPAPKKKTFVTRMSILFSAAATLAIAVFATNALFRQSSTNIAEAAQMTALAETEANDSWIAYLDENTQVESFVTYFEDELSDY